MNVVYSTTVSSVGGRDGTIRSDDGMLDLRVALQDVERYLLLFQRGSTLQYP
jgi:organic hydroperoxide reductase OsmC/OhrA